MSARLPRIIAGAALAVLLGVPAAAGADEPATYTVSSCRAPDGTPIATRAWQADPDDPGAGDTCAAGGSLSVQVAGPALGPGRLSGLRFTAPPGTQIAGYRIHLTASTGGAPLWSQLEAGLAVGSVVAVPPVTQGCTEEDCAFGDPGDPLADGNLVTGSGLPAAGLVLVARCTAGACDPGEGGPPPAVARLWRSAVDVVDPQAPVIGAPEGSLLGPDAVGGRASVQAPVSDEGGGVASVVLRVDGVERARVDAGGDCRTPYVVVAPCPASLPASLELDTRLLADGPHAAQLVATDAAGQVTTSGRLPFTVSNPATGGGTPPPAPTTGAGNGPPTVVVAEPARATITLDRERFTLPARGRQITGVVRRADGSPAAGAQLVVRSRRFGADAPRPRAERTLRTDAAGRFAIPLGLLPRRLSLLLDDPGYRFTESDEVEVRGDLAIAVRALGRGLHNGSTMTLVARIRGAGLGAPDGRTVLVQAFVGGRWATVDSVESDAAGGARWRYRFRNTTRTTLYRFRIRVPRGGPDWPWPATSSDAVRVLVRP